MPKIERYHLNLAGEYRVCSELNKRGIFATVTYGNRKSADVYAIDDRKKRALKIEVKTSQRSQFVTSITQKYSDTDVTAPDFWVLFYLKSEPDGGYVERFFVLSHEEIRKAQAARNRTYAASYKKKHGHDPDFSRGVEKVKVDDVVEFEGDWKKITDALAKA